MTERSLSQLYREGLRAQARRQDLDPECATVGTVVQQLADVVALDDSSIEALARMPEAVAVRRIAADLPRWSGPLALDIGNIQRQEAGALRVTRAVPRARLIDRRSWLGVAVAAGLAVFVVGLVQRDSTPAAADPLVADASSGSLDATAGDAAFAALNARMVRVAAADVLFVDPDASLMAASGVGSPDSIFTDNLDG